jgi:hypothetical protein
VRVSNSTVQPQIAVSTPLRWRRIVIGGVLIEVALVVLTPPLLMFVPNPFFGGAASASGDFTIFFATVAVACLAAGAFFGWWVARPLSSKFVLHGTLTGIVATAIYLAICSVPPTTIAAVFAAYGPFWFLTANGLRIVGSALGAAYQSRRP